MRKRSLEFTSATICFVAFFAFAAQSQDLSAPSSSSSAGTASVNSTIEASKSFFLRLADVYKEDWHPTQPVAPDPIRRGTTVLFRPEIRLEHSYDLAAYDLGTKKTQSIFAGDLTYHF
jgi:hypothetical protein